MFKDIQNPLTSTRASRQTSALLFFSAVTALFVLVAFSPCLKNGLTNWDDNVLLTNNPEVRSLSVENLGRIFTSFNGQLYKPLVTLSFALEYHFFGMSPAVFHATNVLLHLANTLLVLFWMRLVGIRLWSAFVAAMLFGLHPMKVESVAWVTERKDVLFTFFYLSAMIQYEKHTQTRNRRNAGLSIGFFVLSCLSKTVAITLPVILILVDFVKRRPLNRKSLIEKIPYFLITLLFGYVGFVAGTADQKKVYDMASNFLLSGYGIASYFKKFIWPVDLHAIYTHPGSLTPALSSIGSAVWLGVLFIFIRRKSWPVLFFSVFFFLVAILPNIQLIPSVGNILVADRYIYLPSLGLLYGVARILENRKDFGSKPLCVLLIAWLAVSSWHRCQIWKSSVTLWTDILAGSPLSAQAYYSRGSGFEEEKDFEKALADYNRALEINPHHQESWLNRGNVYRLLNNTDEALKNYSKFIVLNPNDSRAWLNKGNLIASQGDIEAAFDCYRKALEINPKFAAVYNNWGQKLLKIGRGQEAVPLFLKGLEVDPTLWQAYLNLGNHSMQIRDFASAARYYQKGLEIEPASDSLRQNLALAMRALREESALFK